MALQIRKLNFLISGKSFEAVGSNPCQCGNWDMKGLVIQSKNGIFHTTVQFCPVFLLMFDRLVHQKQLSRAISEFWCSQVCFIGFSIHALLFWDISIGQQNVYVFLHCFDALEVCMLKLMGKLVAEKLGSWGRWGFSFAQDLACCPNLAL